MRNKSIPEDFYKYRQLNIDDAITSPYNKKRRLNLLQKWVESFKDFKLSDQDIYKGSYWHFKIPIIDSIANDKNYEARQICIQHLIEALCNIINTGHINVKNNKYKIMCLISLPHLFSSELTIFVDKSYYENFFIRTHKCYNLTLITKNQDILEEYEIKELRGTGLDMQCFKEIVDDEDEYRVGELWAIGQLKAW